MFSRSANVIRWMFAICTVSALFFVFVHTRAGAQRGAPALASGCAQGGASTPSSPACVVINSTNRVLLQKIYMAAKAYRAHPTGNLPGGGTNSCAAAMQVIVKNATGATIGDPEVDDWRDLATTSHNGIVLLPGHEAAARQGAIIIWPEKLSLLLGHIGVCIVDGCSQTWSNHSGNGGATSAFAYSPVTKNYITGGISMYNSDPTYLIWEPDHIP